MKNTKPRSAGQHIMEWSLTITPIVLFVITYVWVTIGAAEQKVANALLAVLMVIGAVLSFYLFVRIAHVHKLTPWRELNSLCLGTIGAFVLATVWHVIGFAIPSPHQYFFVYGPLWVVSIMLFLIFMKWFIQMTDKAKYEKF